MIVEIVIKETIVRSMKGLDAFINAENAPGILEEIDNWVNHKLLQENRAFTLTKIDGEVKIIMGYNNGMIYDEEPFVLEVNPILNEVKRKCYKALGKDIPEELLE